MDRFSDYEADDWGIRDDFELIDRGDRWTPTTETPLENIRRFPGDGPGEIIIDPATYRTGPTFGKRWRRATGRRRRQRPRKKGGGGFLMQLAGWRPALIGRDRTVRGAFP